MALLLGALAVDLILMGLVTWVSPTQDMSIIIEKTEKVKSDNSH